MSMASGRVECTHITMTRIYNPNINCAHCRRQGSMGWLYRCTQDVELLIEEDLENGVPCGVDELSSVLPESKLPQKRSPAAHASNDLVSFEETSQANRDSYSSDQINTIAIQRAHVLEVIKETEAKESETSYFGLGLHPNLSATESPPLILGPLVKKPWVPTHECQYKCCHRCRPGLIERSFLSLDAVVDGEPPATAVTGYGFEYFRGRPVSLVKHVENSGFRPNPTRQRISTSESSSSITITDSLTFGQTPNVICAARAVPLNDEVNADSNIAQSSNACGSTSMIRGLSIESTEPLIGDGSAYGSTVHAAFRTIPMIRQGTLKVTSRDLHQTPGIVPNSPGKIWIGRDTDSSAARFGPEGKTLKSCRPATNLRSRFNVDRVQVNDDIELGEALLADNAADDAVSSLKPIVLSLDVKSAKSGDSETDPKDSDF